MGVIKQLTNWGGAILYVCLNILEYIRIHIHIHICNYIYTHMYAYIYMYLYIYICVYILSLCLSLSYYTKMHAPKNRNSPGTLLEPFAVGLQSWANLTTYPGGPSGEVWHTFTLHNFASHTDQKPNPLWNMTTNLSCLRIFILISFAPSPFSHAGFRVAPPRSQVSLREHKMHPCSIMTS